MRKNKLQKSCGNCEGFTKHKKMQFNSGLCDYYDCRTNTDHGKDCKEWKGIKYKREKNEVGYEERS